ncbi:MAG: THUMP domain-containing protein [Bacteroidales bacterium]
MPEYIAKTLFGLEQVLADELRELGADGIRTLNRAVGFSGDKKLLYKANFNLRTALKILVPIKEGEINNEQELYEFVRTINWSRYLGAEDTLAVEVSLSTSLFSHTQYIAQKIKDAVVDQFRERFGSRPSVNLDNPTLRINAFVSNKTVTLSRDSSGESLHRRGYRVKQGPAPINEVLAAGLIKLSGWDYNMPLVDFMCGSGTIAIEAALMSLRIPPGDLRMEYGFQRWRDYDPVLFNEVVKERKPAEDEKINIHASDLSPDAVRLAQRHAQNAGVLKRIRFSTCHFNDLVPPPPPGLVIINPPYGERIEQLNLNELYQQIGDRLKKNYPGYNAWIISSNAEAVKHIGLKPTPRIIVYNGQLECRFNRYSLYEGSKKASKN